MKKVVLISAAIMYCFFAFSQKCKFMENETDKFTKKIKQTTEPNTIWRDKWSGNNMTIHGCKLDTSIYFRYRYSSNSIFSILKDAKLILLFDDESKVTLFAIDGCIPDQVGGAISNWVGFSNYYASDSEKQIILKKRVKSIRIYFRDGYVDKEVRDKDADCFKNALKCVMI